MYEPRDDFLSPWGVCHLWMELNTVEWFRVMSNGSKWRGFRMTDYVEIRRGSRDLIAMRHPHLTGSNRVSAALRITKNCPSTSISSPSPSNRASTDKWLLPNLFICTLAKPYSRCEHFATVPPRFHAISWREERGRGAWIHQRQKARVIVCGTHESCARTCKP